MNQLGLQHIYPWKQHKETPCISHLYLKLAKTLFFFLSCIFFHLQNQKTGGRNRLCREVGTCERGDVAGKEVGG
jgi:hypothetical protein